MPGEGAMQPATPRFDGIDVLRGLSIFLVILLHISIRMNGAGHPFRNAMPPLLFHFLFRNGNNGVTVFFAISGFLITLTSIRRFGGLRAMRPAVFYRIRFARIAPLLLLVLALLSALHLLHAEGFTILPQRASLPRALFAALTFHLNYLEAVRGWLPANWDVLWSLSVEEMFYLVFPLCVLLFRPPLFVALLALFVALGPFARTVWAFNEIWAEKTYLGGMDSIALGCLSAILIAARPHFAKRYTFLLGTAGSALMLLIFIWPPWSAMKYIGKSGLDGTVLALGTCLVIIATVQHGFAGTRLTQPIQWLGRNSYEVYLTHEFVIVWATLLYASRPIGPQWLWVILIVVLSALLGAAVARHFSEPLNLRLRGRSRHSPITHGSKNSQ